MKRLLPLAGSVLAGAVVLAGCGTDENGAPAASGAASVDCAPGGLTAQGSSAQGNAMDAWIKAYQSACSGVDINYQPTGSGAGVKAFTQGKADFAGSDSALKDAERPAADARCAGGSAVSLPLVVGPVAVAYRLPGVSKLNLSPATLAAVFSGKVAKWNDSRIAAENPGVSLPGLPVQAFHRSDSSGTTENFTRYLAATAGAGWGFEPGKEWSAPGGQGVNKSSGVAEAVRSGDGAIGYLELSYAKNSNLSIARLRNGAGEYAELTDGSVQAAVAAAKVVGTGSDLALTLDYATRAKGAYPLVLVTYEVVCTKGLAADKAKLVRSFLAYAVGTAGQREIAAKGYAPLPESLRGRVADVVRTLG